MNEISMLNASFPSDRIVSSSTVFVKMTDRSYCCEGSTATGRGAETSFQNFVANLRIPNYTARSTINDNRRKWEDVGSAV